MCHLVLTFTVACCRCFRSFLQLIRSSLWSCSATSPVTLDQTRQHPTHTQKRLGCPVVQTLFRWTPEARTILQATPCAVLGGGTERCSGREGPKRGRLHETLHGVHLPERRAGPDEAEKKRTTLKRLLNMSSATVCVCVCPTLDKGFSTTILPQAGGQRMTSRRWPTKLVMSWDAVRDV